MSRIRAGPCKSIRRATSSIPARYARAYAWHKGGYPDRALAETDSLLRDGPRDPFFLELKGQILLESGKPKRGARLAAPGGRRSLPDQPLISALFGHALISTEDKDNFEEAKRVLRSAIGRDNDQSVRLVPARNRLRPRGRSRPRRSGHRRALQSPGPAEARSRQCRACHVAAFRPERPTGFAPRT